MGVTTTSRLVLFMEVGQPLDTKSGIFLVCLSWMHGILKNDAAIYPALLQELQQIPGTTFQTL